MFKGDRGFQGEKNTFIVNIPSIHSIWSIAIAFFKDWFLAKISLKFLPQKKMLSNSITFFLT